MSHPNGVASEPAAAAPHQAGRKKGLRGCVGGVCAAGSTIALFLSIILFVFSRPRRDVARRPSPLRLPSRARPFFANEKHRWRDRWRAVT
jgi:hypothetical protein